MLDDILEGEQTCILLETINKYVKVKYLNWKDMLFFQGHICWHSSYNWTCIILFHLNPLNNYY